MRVFRNEVFEASDGENGIRLVEVRQAEYDALVAERDRLNAFVSWLSGVATDNDWCAECGAWQEVEDAIDRLLIDLATSAPINPR
jgi:nicotinate-nucleotide pyrophosphorylase